MVSAVRMVPILRAAKNRTMTRSLWHAGAAATRFRAAFGLALLCLYVFVLPALHV